MRRSTQWYGETHASDVSQRSRCDNEGTRANLKLQISESEVQQALFASILLYNFGLTLTKISILLQYLRITISRPVRIVCWCFLWFAVLYCIETFFAGVFQCIPVAKFWNQGLPGKCVDTAALYYANAGVNIAQDLSLVVLPFFILRKLIMPRGEKLMLIFVLGLGGVYVSTSLYHILNTNTMVALQLRPCSACTRYLFSMSPKMLPGTALDLRSGLRWNSMLVYYAHRYLHFERCSSDTGLEHS